VVVIGDVGLMMVEAAIMIIQGMHRQYLRKTIVVMMTIIGITTGAKEVLPFSEREV
jgi:hypothetical protein